jgi:hypothetical protein
MQPMKRRTTLMLTVLSLLAAPLGLAVSSSPAHAVPPAPGDYVPRWCDTNPAPCLVSASRNGTTVTASDPTYEVLSTGPLHNDFDYFGFLVQGTDISKKLSTSDTWQLLFDTGTLDPNYMEGFAGVPDMDRVVDGDGTYHLRYTAKPIVYTNGCDTTSPTWPWPCTSVPANEDVKLEAEAQDRSDEFVNFFRAQSPQGVNGIFLETAPDGSRYLSSEMVNSHYRADGITVYKGQVRFRIPYKMLHDSFGVPDPSTMVASSLTGTVNGGTTGATFNVYHDPDGGGMFVDITNLTFSRKVIKVSRGVIVPTRPTGLHAKRRTTHAGRLSFTLSTPRGARVTGYKVRCVSRGGQVVTNTKSTPTSPIRISGLRRGVGYSCKVRATSRAGLGPWSLVVRMPRHR